MKEELRTWHKFVVEVWSLARGKDYDPLILKAEALRGLLVFLCIGLLQNSM
jgi:hypothetical protein